MTPLYVSFCKRCDKKTPHLIYAISRYRGIKIKCVYCGMIKSRYYNAQLLESYQSDKGDNKKNGRKKGE